MEVSKWLSAVFAARALLSDITCLTPTARPTELGSLTSARLRQSSTELTPPFVFAPVAFAPVKLSVRKAG